jgi:hypothetical protein
MEILKNDNIFIIYNYLKLPETIMCLGINKYMNIITEEYLLINKRRYRIEISNYISLLKLTMISKNPVFLADRLYREREANQQMTTTIIKHKRDNILLIGLSVAITGIFIFLKPIRISI